MLNDLNARHRLLTPSQARQLDNKHYFVSWGLRQAKVCFAVTSEIQSLSTTGIRTTRAAFCLLNPVSRHLFCFFFKIKLAAFLHDWSCCILITCFCDDQLQACPVEIAKKRSTRGIHRIDCLLGWRTSVTRWCQVERDPCAPQAVETDALQHILPFVISELHFYYRWLHIVVTKVQEKVH